MAVVIDFLNQYVTEGELLFDCIVAAVRHEFINSHYLPNTWLWYRAVMLHAHIRTIGESKWEANDECTY